MKHYLRRHEMAGFAIPECGRRLDQIEITHAGSDDKVHAARCSFDAAGIAETSWQIPPEARLGEYEVVLTEHDESDPERRWFQSGSFRVEQFRVPTMTAAREGRRAAHLIRPLTVPLDLYVGYLSGGADAHAPVTLRTLVEPRVLAFDGYDDFSFGGEDVHEGITRPNEPRTTTRPIPSPATAHVSAPTAAARGEHRAGASAAAHAGRARRRARGSEASLPRHRPRR